MIPLFIGLTASNLFLLLTVFSLGLFAIGTDGTPSSVYAIHIGVAIVAGLFTTMTHLSAYMYFMATTKWLEAATDKANFALEWFVAPARRHKSRAFAVAMTAILCTIFTMFAGAAADPTVRPWWPGEVHMGFGIVALLANLGGALAEYQLIQKQKRLMEEALQRVNAAGGSGSASPA